MKLEELPEYVLCYFCNNRIAPPVTGDAGLYHSNNYWCVNCPLKFPDINSAITTLNDDGTTIYSHLYVKMNKNKTLHYRVDVKENTATIFYSDDIKGNFSFIYKFPEVPNIGPHNAKEKIKTILLFL